MISASAESELLLPAVEPRTMRLLSWNVHGLPFQSGTPARLRRVAAVIAAQRPDVVLLQEIWLGRYVRLLRQALGAYDLAYAPRSLLRWPRGGLVTLLRRDADWRATGVAFHPFAASAPRRRIAEGDGIGGKGLLVVTVVSAEGSISVVNTHLQSQYRGRPYVAERRAQLDELSAALQRVDGGGAMLIGGDFNTGAGEPLYGSHLEALGIDLGAEERRYGHGGTHFDDDGGHDECIDYVFARRFDARAALQHIASEAADRPYSDHDGLLVRLTYARMCARRAG